MRKAFGAACGIAAVLVAFACSSSSPSHPPVQNGCNGKGCYGGSSGGGVSSSGSGGGTSSGGDASDDVTTGTCGVASNASQCMLCQATNCCQQLNGCFGNPTCEALMGCVVACAGGATCASPSCVSTCESKFSSATSAYEALHTNCECGATCNAKCTQLGVGDPCGGSLATCNPNLMCVNSWCTRSCTSDADCVGVGANDGNYLGFPNACIHTTGGLNACAPGCNAAQDCAGFTGTTCVVAQDISGGNAFVCGAIGDAATE